MTISLHNNITTSTAQIHLQNAAKAAEASVYSLASGKKGAFLGDMVAENSIATGLETDNIASRTALDVVAQAIGVTDISIAPLEELISLVQSQYKTAASAASDTMGDTQRSDLDITLQSTKQQYDTITRQATFNGLSLLTGEFSGDSYLRTSSTVARKVYDITRTDQFLTHGSVNNNSVLAQGSGVEVIDKIGQDHASGTLSFHFKNSPAGSAGHNLQAGDKILANGRAFTAVNSTVSAESLASNEFHIGSNLHQTLQNAAAKLNSSDFKEVQKGIYTVEAEQAGTSATNYKLVVTAANSGTEEKMTLGAIISSPADVGYTRGYGKLTFNSNFLKGDKIKINSQEFVALELNDHVSVAGKSAFFRIGQDLEISLKNLIDSVKKTNTPSLADCDFELSSSQGLGSGNPIDSIGIKAKQAGTLPISEHKIGYKSIASTDNTIITQNNRVRENIAFTVDFQAISGVPPVATKITVNSTTLSAVAAGATPTADQFALGTDLSSTLNNIKDRINTHASLRNDFLASVIGNKLTITNLKNTNEINEIKLEGVGGTVTISEKNGGLIAQNLVAADPATATGLKNAFTQATEYSRRSSIYIATNATTAPATGDTIKIGGETFSFDATAAATDVLKFKDQADLVTKINNNDNLKTTLHASIAKDSGNKEFVKLTSIGTHTAAQINSVRTGTPTDRAHIFISGQYDISKLDLADNAKVESFALEKFTTLSNPDRRIEGGYEASYNSVDVSKYIDKKDNFKLGDAAVVIDLRNNSTSGSLLQLNDSIRVGGRTLTVKSNSANPNEIALASTNNIQDLVNALNTSFVGSNASTGDTYHASVGTGAPASFFVMPGATSGDTIDLGGHIIKFDSTSPIPSGSAGLTTLDPTLGGATLANLVGQINNTLTANTNISGYSVAADPSNAASVIFTTPSGAIPYSFAAFEAPTELDLGGHKIKFVPSFGLASLAAGEIEVLKPAGATPDIADFANAANNAVSSLGYNITAIGKSTFKVTPPAATGASLIAPKVQFHASVQNIDPPADAPYSPPVNGVTKFSLPTATGQKNIDFGAAAGPLTIDNTTTPATNSATLASNLNTFFAGATTDADIKDKYQAVADGNNIKINWKSKTDLTTFAVPASLEVAGKSIALGAGSATGPLTVDSTGVTDIAGLINKLNNFFNATTTDEALRGKFEAAVGTAATDMVITSKAAITTLGASQGVKIEYVGDIGAEGNQRDIGFRFSRDVDLYDHQGFEIKKGTQSEAQVLLAGGKDIASGEAGLGIIEFKTGLINNYQNEQKVKIMDKEFTFYTICPDSNNPAQVEIGSNLKSSLEELVRQYNKHAYQDRLCAPTDCSGVLEEFAKCQLEYRQKDDDTGQIIIRANYIGAKVNDLSINLGNGEVEYKINDRVGFVNSNSDYNFKELATDNSSTITGRFGNTIHSVEGRDDRLVVTETKINDGVFNSAREVEGEVINGDSMVAGTKASLQLKVRSHGAVSNFTLGDKFHLSYGAQTQEFEFTNAATSPNQVAIGSDLVKSMENLVKAISENGALNQNLSVSFDATATRNGDGSIDLGAKGSLIIRGKKVEDEENDKIKFRLTNMGGGGSSVQLSSGGAYQDYTNATSLREILSSVPAGNKLEHSALARRQEPLTRDMQVNVNDLGLFSTSNSAIEFDLDNGSNRNSGAKASARINFSGNTGVNYESGHKITLNGQEFIFMRDNEQAENPANIKLGNSIDDALTNLCTVVNESALKGIKGGANEAWLRYDASTKDLTINYKQSGLKGNDYSFNFGGGAVKYNAGEGNISDSKLISIKDTERNNSTFANLGTEDLQLIFSTSMQGALKGMNLTFKEGDRGTKPDEFTANGLKFSVQLDGATYETGFIALSGGNKSGNEINGTGYNRLGDTIAGDTDLHFYRVGSDRSEAGFSLKVKSDGIKIHESTSLEAIQRELNALSQDATNAMKVGNLKIGLGIEGKTVKDFGLKSINQYQGSGSAAPGSGLSGTVEILEGSGKEKAKGVIEFSSNDFQAGDFLSINGAKFHANDDFTVGATLTETLNNLARQLNMRKDDRIAQATYEVTNDNRLGVIYKQAGTIGNNFTLSASFGANSVNGSRINAGLAGNIAFSKETPVLKLGEKADNLVIDKYVVTGENHQVADQPMPAQLLGKIENFRTYYVDGASQEGKDFTPNSIKFSTTIGGRVYQGQIDLSGGYRSASGSFDGSGYNGMGNYIAAGTKIMMGAEDNTHSIALTLSDSIELPDRLDVSVTRNDVLRALEQVTEKMAKGIEEIQISQKRNIASFNEKKADGTVLQGIKKDNIYVTSPDFTEDGNAGFVSKFHVDNKDNMITVKVDNELYRLKLEDTRELGGLGDKFDSTNQIIKGGADTTLTLKGENSKGARALVINLQGVRDIDISSESGALALEKALNECFYASEDRGLRFVVGIKPSDVIYLNFPDVSSSKIYVDENDNPTEINIKTKKDAIRAVEILSISLDKLKQVRAKLGSLRTQFESISRNLHTSIQANSNAISTLVDADVPTVSAEFALRSLRVNAASTAFLHSLNALKELVSSLLRANQ